MLLLFYTFESFLPQRLLRVSHRCSSVSKSPQVFKTFLSILANLNNAVVWIISTCPLISKSSYPFINFLGVVPSASTTIGITVTSCFSILFCFHGVVCRDGKVHNSADFLFCCWFVLSVDVWQKLGDPLVSQNPSEFCPSHSPGRILDCTYTTCSYGQILIFCTTYLVLISLLLLLSLCYSSDSRSLRLCWTLPSILADLNDAVIRMFSSRPLISKVSSSYTNTLVTVPSAPVTIGITVTFMFRSFFISLARSRYLFLFSLSFRFTQPERQSLLFGRFIFFFLTITRSGRLVEIRWSVCSSKSKWILYILFSRAGSGLRKYHLVGLLNLNFLLKDHLIHPDVFDCIRILWDRSFCLIHHIVYICYFVASCRFMHWYHHHHHVVPLARISLTLSRHFSLSFIATGRSSGLYSVSSISCCMYVRAGCPAFAWPYAGVHRSTSLMSPSLFLQQCSVCLVRLA